MDKFEVYLAHITINMLNFFMLYTLGLAKYFPLNLPIIQIIILHLSTLLFKTKLLKKKLIKCK